MIVASAAGQFPLPHHSIVFASSHPRGCVPTKLCPPKESLVPCANSPFSGRARSTGRAGFGARKSEKTQVTDRGAMVVVQVQSLTGAATDVEVGPDCTHSELRKAVCSKLGVNADEVDLLTKGAMLSDESMSVVRRGSAVKVVPRTRTGFSMRKDLQGMGGGTMGMEMRSLDDITRFLDTLKELPEGLGDAAVSVTVETADGPIEQKLPLRELSSTLDSLAKQLSGGTPAAAAAPQPTAGPADMGTGTDTEADAVRKRKMKQDAYAQGVELYEERERKKAETSTISSAIDKLRDRRAAVAARREQKRAARRRNRRPSAVEASESHIATAAMMRPQFGFGGFKKGFLL
mmetsp:Transcript_28156/g.73805  ORF Transcript_28156/g.73805 Transcript_28156/m.73805 type:complete len:347 (-) Transcript_28156:95-1135(-)